MRIKCVILQSAGQGGRENGQSYIARLGASPAETAAAKNKNCRIAEQIPKKKHISKL